jgi:hypothetical protein
METPTPTLYSLNEAEKQTMPNQSTAGEQPSNSQAVQARMLALYDDLVEFEYQCSFLCDAFASIVRQEEVIDPETIKGVSVYSGRIKEQLSRLKDELGRSCQDIGLLTATTKST